MAQVVTEKERQLRKICFVPCETKQALHNWIKYFLGFDIPDCKVDPESTSTPMDMIWEVYERALRNDDPDFSSVLYFASRDSFKTFCAAIIEVLALVHLGRDIGHMGAIEAQARKCASYVKMHLRRPILRDFKLGDNQEKIELVWYTHKQTGEVLTQQEASKLPENQIDDYKEHRRYMKIVICTMQGANSDHVPLFVVDEVDVVSNPAAYEESKMIPGPIDGLLPIRLLTSTRKFSFGLVQKEIDAASNTGLKIRHWNILDVTQSCRPQRHHPDKPKKQIYYSTDLFQVLDPEEWARLPEDKQVLYTSVEAFHGCAKCKIFPACRGLLIHGQKSTSALLRPVEHVINQFKSLSLPAALAQLLCLKPSTEGLIYPAFDRDLHMLTPAQMAERITGMQYPEDFTKDALIRLFKEKGAYFVGGIDFGSTHNFVIVIGAVYGNVFYCLTVESMAELLPDQQVMLAKQAAKIYEEEEPYVKISFFPDPENPQMIKVLRKAGLRMKNWNKGPGTVLAGIEIVRLKMRPAADNPQMYLVLGDPNCELMAKRLSEYHWKLDAAGKPTKIPDEADDDEPDAFRYAVMNPFGSAGGIKVAAEPTKVRSNLMPLPTPDYTPQNWMTRVIQDQLGVTGSADIDEISAQVVSKPTGKGGFHFDI